MMITNLTIPETKKRERAQLSNLFERLSTRLPRADTPSDATKDISKSKYRSLPTPEEFSTILRDLSVIRRADPSRAKHSRPRRNTVASTTGNSNSSQERRDQCCDECLLAAEEYPFTFKHMIHKLYKKDDWLRTVKEVLEKSKKDFKPLAECDPNQNPSKCLDHRGSRVMHKDVPLSRVGKRASCMMKGRELRRMSMAVGHDAEERPSGNESLRALKKRCVGIRKSISGHPSGDQGASKKGTFVFASTISSTECPGEEIYLHFPSPQVSPSESCFSDAGDDTTAPQSPISPITPTSPASPIFLCTTGYTAGVKRRVSMSHHAVMLKAVPPSRLTERNLNRLSTRFSSETNEDLD